MTDHVGLGFIAALRAPCGRDARAPSEEKLT